MDGKCSQLIKCILCYASLVLISNAKTQVWLQKYLKKN
jgi:hypothetical protein